MAHAVYEVKLDRVPAGSISPGQPFVPVDRFHRRGAG